MSKARTTNARDADSPDGNAGTDPAEPIREPRRWRDNGWTALVIKNEDDDGWAVSMTPDGQSEPALTGPWTMGRDKKNPKPLDAGAFNTLVKTAHEVVRRHEQHLHATLHQQVTIHLGNDRYTVALDIVPDEFDPHALLAADDVHGERVAIVKVSTAFKLNHATALRWAESGFAKPA